MIARAATLAVGLVGGFGAAQLPEFSQQYVQRLGGAVDALTQVAADFDASAEAEGLSRAEALAQMQGTDFLERRRQDMTATFARLDRLQNDLVRLEPASSLRRVALLGRSADAAVAGEVWKVFQPAVPVTTEGALFAGLGFFAGGGLAGGTLRLLRTKSGRRRA